MQQRPRDPEPVAGQPKPRYKPPGWIDAATQFTMVILVGLVLYAAASSPQAAASPHPTQSATIRP